MSNPTQTTCRWCGAAITNPKREQRFCSSSHRYRWHKAQQISPANFHERVRAIVRDELKRAAGKPRAAPEDRQAWVNQRLRRNFSQTKKKLERWCSAESFTMTGFQY